MAVTTIGGNVLAHTIVGVTITPAAVNAGTAVAQTFTVPGVKVGDAVFVSPPSFVAGAALNGAAVTEKDTVSLQFSNPTGSNATPAAGVYLFTVLRPEGVQPYAAFAQ